MQLWEVALSLCKSCPRLIKYTTDRCGSERLGTKELTALSQRESESKLAAFKSTIIDKITSNVLSCDEPVSSATVISCWKLSSDWLHFHMNQDKSR